MPVCASCGAENRAGARFCDSCGAELVDTTPAEQRKTVTVLFCDLTGSTELGETLDPEALRAVLASYFERMKSIVERHGGSVEKFIGDAVMAVFGVPTVHEDDALRALRAAVEMRAALPELGVRGRIGVATGQVVTGTAERLATGDAVNVAARLEQAARPGEVLIGEETYRLTRDSAEVEVVEPLDLKGKSEPVPAYRLLGVKGGLERRHETPLIGRERELLLLASAWERAVSGRACQLLTILGAAGVGKSRLAAEFLGSVGDAVVVSGRCLPYGEGITYWPVVEAVKQIPDVDVEPRVQETIRALLGPGTAATSSDEIAWAFRKLLEAVAADRPVVCIFDDIHWGEERFLDLVEHVGDLSRDAPILLLCMARPDLLDRRSGWAGGKLNAINVLLEPLAPEESERLIQSLGDFDDALVERVRAVAEGNPLFVEETVRLVRESGNDDVSVPPTIQALLAARVDQLAAPERDVLQRGAVEGRVFHSGAVQALAPEEPSPTPRLTALVRKEFVRPDRAQVPGEDAYRFRHLLVRDAAYDALPKASRAELHERLAAWLESDASELVELDELVGYHLEQATRYRQELQLLDERTTELAERGARALAAAGRSAGARGDVPAAVNLLERAARLLAEDDAERLRLLPDLGRALAEGGDWARAETVLIDAVTRSRSKGEELVWADALAALTWVRGHTGSAAPGDLVNDAQEAIEVFERRGDEAGLARALFVSAGFTLWRGEVGAAEALLERSAELARRAGDPSQELQSLRFLLIAVLVGPTSVTEGLRRLEALEGERAIATATLSTRAQLEAMRGDIDTGRQLIADARALAEDLGRGTAAANLAGTAGEIELLGGSPATAEPHLRRACEALAAMSDWGHYVNPAVRLAETLLFLGRLEDAERELDVVDRTVSPDDAQALIGSRRVRGLLLARHGDLEAGERVARAATTLAEGTDYLDDRALATWFLAEVLSLAGKAEEGRATLALARDLFERKGNLAMLERTRAAEGAV